MTPFEPTAPRLPFAVDVGGEVLHCTSLLRHLPGRRVVCGGTWCDREVVAKLYVDPRRGSAHARREERGVRAMVERGITTPALLHAGPTGDGEALIFERIGNARSAREAWATADAAERRHLLRLMAEAVASHHEAGLVQEDLHLGNFLYAEERLYSVDGDGFRIVERLTRERALDNLALLLAQLRPEYDPLVVEAYRDYAAVRGWPADGEAERFAERAKRTRTACVDAHLAQKIFRECTAFSVESKWRRFTVIDRRYRTEAMQRGLREADRLMAEGRSLQQGRTSTVAIVEVDGRPLVFKRYNIKGILHAIRRAVQPTRAAISWRNAQRLTLYGIATPHPVAMVERRFGPLRSVSYVVTEFCEGIQSAQYFANASQDEAEETARRIVGLLRQLRALKLSHGDLKATNLLIAGDAIFLTDLDAMRQHRDETAAARAHAEDVQRFMRNWDGQPAVAALFRGLLAA